MQILRPVSLGSLALISVASLSASCNDHPVEPLDQVLNAVNRVENRLPAKTKLDFLFIIDNSNSMCEEQKRLADNFKEFSNFLFDELQGAADYRIAVVSTDIGAQTNPPQGNISQRGQLLYSPADYTMPVCNDLNGTPFAPNTADCDPSTMMVNPIISSEELDSSPAPDKKAELERQFRCRATLGIGGFYYEKGLEAMRLALSCNGPNSHLFQDCCVNYGSENSFYNPACVIPDGDPEPEFLRPDATLVVVFITDENDCSTPSDAPSDTSRLICRNGGTVDGNGNSIPDIYESYCRDSAATCYESECGEYREMGPQSCRQARCDIEYSQNIECEWYRNRLTPVREYRDFLQSLKARPLDQILVAPIVGFRAYTPGGNEIRYNNGQVTSPECTGDDTALLTSETCCPGGNCVGLRQVQPTCKIPSKGIIAYAGTRYLQLAEEMGDNGLGCPPGSEPTVVSPEELRPQPGKTCVNICTDSFAEPLQVIKSRVANLLNTYCIDRLPACLVPAVANADGTVTPERACETDAERENSANYPIVVSKRCTREGCDVPLPLTQLAPSEWELRLNQGACVAQVVLRDVPAANSEIFVEFLVGVGENLTAEGAQAGVGAAQAPVAGAAQAPAP